MKIGLCGTMRVGKTTLVKALKELDQFKDYKFATERSKYLSDLGIPLNTDSTLKGQTVFLSERCAELMHDKLITDRTIFDVMAFAKCSKSIDLNESEAFEDYAARFIREYDYIFYISPEGIPIEDNGVRETDANYRKIIDRSINTLLTKYNHRIKKLHILEGSTEDRIYQMVNYIGF